MGHLTREAAAHIWEDKFAVAILINLGADVNAPTLKNDLDLDLSRA